MKALLKSILPIVFSMSTLQVTAQQHDSIRLVVQYKTLHIIDTTQPQNSKKESITMLFIGDQISLSTRLGSIQSEARLKWLAESFPNQNPKKSSTDNWGAPVQFIRNFNRNTLISHTVLIGTCYEVEESIPTINWSISPETKKIQNYTCQKANASFRGRNYEVWFCTDLPFSLGPWKLGGLPGLILEAYDDKKEIVFTLDQISKTFTFNPYPPINGGAPFRTVPDETLYTITPLYTEYAQKKIEKTELLKTVKLYQQDPSEFLKKYLNNPNLQGMGTSAGSNGQPIHFNNHIEKEGYN